MKKYVIFVPLLLLMFQGVLYSQSIKPIVCRLAAVETQFDDQKAWKRSESLERDGYLVVTFKNRTLPGYSVLARTKGREVHRLVVITGSQSREEDAVYMGMMFAFASIAIWGEDGAQKNLGKLIELATAAASNPGTGKERVVGGLKASAGAVKASDGLALMLDISGSKHP